MFFVGFVNVRTCFLKKCDVRLCGFGQFTHSPIEKFNAQSRPYQTTEFSESNQYPFHFRCSYERSHHKAPNQIGVLAPCCLGDNVVPFDFDSEHIHHVVV